MTTFLTRLAIATFFSAAMTIPVHAVTIDWVTVGDPGNASDPLGSYTGYVRGAVNYEYRIGKYEVTIQQYADFLNAVARSDPYSLWSTFMESPDIAGISRTGISGEYSYSVIGPAGLTPAGADSAGNRPITCVSWFDAARFANWLHNGQGSGGTETGAYTLIDGQTSGNAPAKNPGAQFYIPNWNEWYKAAYYSPVKGGPNSPGYYTYATQSDTAPGNSIGSGANQANYYAGQWTVTQSPAANQNLLTNVGAFTNSASFYGTFDQTGNVEEWNDTPGGAGAAAERTGGDYGSYRPVSLDISFSETSWESGYTGFRLAAPVAVPEPSTYAMAVAGLACGSYSLFRSRRAR